MGASDVVVMNLGLHDDPRKGYADLPMQIPPALEWWRQERAAGRAPRLLWRQATPQHWNTPMGKFQTHEDVTRTAITTKVGCQPPREGAADAFPLYDQGVSDLVRRSGDWADVLPIFAATWARYDEHPPLKLWETRYPKQVQDSAHWRAANQTFRDCTHWCLPGPVPRFWTQALMRWLMLNN